jgi:leucyl-tRNA synthetase
MGPLETVKPWQSGQIQGVRRFRDRLYATGLRPLGDAIEPATRRLLHRTTRKVTRDVEALRFNTAISAMMELLNHLGELPDPLPREAARTLILLVSPFAPHVAEELWQKGGHDRAGTGTLAHEAWPTWDETLCQEDAVEIAVQVDGRVRGRAVLPRTASAEEARAAALAAAGVAPHVAGRTVKKLVYRPGEIVNLVVS